MKVFPESVFKQTIVLRSRAASRSSTCGQRQKIYIYIYPAQKQQETTTAKKKKFKLKMLVFCENADQTKDMLTGELT